MKKKTVKKTAPKKSASKKATKPSAKKPAKKPTTKPTKSNNKSTTAKKSTTEQKGLVTVEIKIHSDNKGGHPHVMLGQVQDKNVSVGITHDKHKGKKHNNIPLQHNPLGENKQAYMRKQGTVDKKSNYSSTSKIGKLTKEDKAKAQKIGDKAKQKHLAKQQTKKK